ncbi:MAG: NAD-dependent epimerase/dehydratase family protein [Chloroflexi bacterium]|nr:NAD-dependent epimerase/dehydratase family protein [Chloroflexota bacterium]
MVVTGGAGLVGGAVIRVLRDRGDTVVALVRDPRRASFLADLGVELVASDLFDVAALTENLRGADAAIHAAGRYRVGIPQSERGAMWDANVGTATRVFDAAEAAGTPQIVYVSTVNVFGDTRGKVVEETYRRDLAEGFLSWYDETKYGAHELAEQRIASGAPIVIVMPSQVYGPGDHSGFGDQLRRAHAGTLRYRAVDDVRIGLVHADDLAGGIMGALDRGVAGQAYILSGPNTTFAEAIAIAARVGGHASPRLRIPHGVLRALAPFGRLVGQPNLAEILSASAGVTYLASPRKAEQELGFTARPIEIGLRDTFDAA